MKKSLTIVLILSLIMSFGVFAEAEGTNDSTVVGQYQTITWEYNKDSKSLLLSGYGTIPAYNTEGLGYNEYKNEIESINMMPLTGNSTFEIGDRAFYSFKKLKSFRASTNLTKIGVFAFERCYSLESLVLSDRITSLPYGFICDCDSLKTFDIPESVTSLDAAAFMGNALLSITLPEGISDIPDETFLASSNLKTVHLPHSVKRISIEAFNGCGKLEDVYYDGTLEEWEAIEIYSDSWSIHDSSFDNAHFHYDFYGSYPVEESAISQSGSYGNCSWSLSANGLLTISGNGAMPDAPNGMATPWVQYYKNIKSVVIEEGITRIGNNTIFGLINLKKLEIPDSVSSIGEAAIFGNSALRIVWIGSGLKTVEKLAFGDTDKIKTIIFNGKQSDWDSVTIAGSYNTILEEADIICRSEEDTTLVPVPVPDKVKLTLKGKTYKTAIVYSWNKVTGAKSYKVYLAKAKSFKRVANTKNLKVKVKKLKRHSNYKAYVIAYDKNGKKLAKSQQIKVKTK